MEGNAGDIRFLWNDREAVGREEVDARKSPMRPVGLGLE